MKRTLKLLAMLFAFAALFALFAACNDLPEIPPEGASITIIIGVEEEENFGFTTLTAADTFEFVTHQRFVGGALDELVAAENIVFTYTPGRFISRLGSLENNFAASEFIMFYATGVDIRFVTPLTQTVGGYTFWQTNFGIDTMPVIDGAVYLFMLESFS